ncbi:MAG: magnesium chelatase domain-containing protein [bacterium]|nr:magnesium chelatase domain-containing protein [bacterium]
MAKEKIVFVCQECSQVYSRWQGKCNACGSWNSLAEQISESKVSSREKQHTAQQIEQYVTSAAEATALKGSFSRFSTGIEELDRCLGTQNDGKKGIVQGSVVLLGGQPGIGKSTLLSQVVLNWCQAINVDYSCNKCVKNEKNSNSGKKVDKEGKTFLPNQIKESEEPILPRVMYVCGEESPQQINLRLQRLLTKSELLADLALEYVTTTNVDLITQIVTTKQPTLLIVDSIQTLHTDDLAGPAGSLGQVKESSERIAKVAKQNHIPTFLVGHVTKEGDLAGPKVLEHLVDAIFELTGDRSGELRFLRTLKNRFGANDEVGVFRLMDTGMIEIKNPSAYFLQSTQTQIPGSGIVCVMEGTRPLLTEVQALVLPSQLAMPRRVGRGVDLSRVQVLAAVLQKHCGLPLGTADIFLSVVGGMRIQETGIDLGLAAAIASSLAEKPLPQKALFIGEIGLMGEIRPVSAFERRVKEAKRLGYEEIYSFQTHKKVRDLLKDLNLLKK